MPSQGLTPLSAFCECRLHSPFAVPLEMPRHLGVNWGSICARPPPKVYCVSGCHLREVGVTVLLRGPVAPDTNVCLVPVPQFSSGRHCSVPSAVGAHGVWAALYGMQLTPSPSAPRAGDSCLYNRVEKLTLPWSLVLLFVGFTELDYVESGAPDSWSASQPADRMRVASFRSHLWLWAVGWGQLKEEERQSNILSSHP